MATWTNRFPADTTAVDAGSSLAFDDVFTVDGRTLGEMTFDELQERVWTNQSESSTPTWTNKSES